MIDEIRRSTAFLRKAWRAGYIPIGLGTVRTLDIVYPVPTKWFSEYLVDRTVYSTPHYDFLCHFQEGMDIRGFPYYEHHLALRGQDHPRPDEWILAMATRFWGLYQSIKRNGYCHTCLADRIAVTSDKVLWDGGHRLACLAALGWSEVPVVWVRKVR